MRGGSRIIYDSMYIMKEWILEIRENIIMFFRNYGKIIAISILFFIGGVMLYQIIILLTPQKLRVSFLDIGQGDSILIQTPSGHTMLVDGGPTNKILEKLSKQLNYFDNDIDVIVATHPDADHVTGLIPVLEKYNVHTVVISKAESITGVFADLTKHIEDESADVRVAEINDEIDFHDGVIATILYPPKNYTEKFIGKKNDTNDASVSMEIKFGNDTFLLTGDLPSTEEGKLIIAGLDKNITVYKAGHHGSKSSNGELLLKYSKPEYAVISAGKDNRYGHPNPEALERLQKYSKEILSTITHGTISFITDGRLMEVETEK